MVQEPRTDVAHSQRRELVSAVEDNWISLEWAENDTRCDRTEAHSGCSSAIRPEIKSKLD